MRGLAGILDPVPVWASGAEIPVTAGIAALERNARALDAITLYDPDLTQAHAYRPEPVNDNPLVWGDWGFVYYPGLTTLTLVTDSVLAVPGISERVRIRANGVTLLEAALTAGVQTHTVTTLASQGYASGQAVEVQIQIYSVSALPSDDSYGRYYLRALYVSPVLSCVGAWPGVPTFTSGGTGADGLSLAKLDQLSAACQWIVDLLRVSPRPLTQQIRGGTSVTVTGLMGPLWSGGGARGPCDRLRLRMAYDIVANQSETLTLRVNGSSVGSVGPLVPGQRGFHSFDVDLSAYSATTPISVRLETLVNLEPASLPGQPSRYSFFWARFGRSARTLLTQPAATAPAASLTWATLRGRLNGLAAVFQGIRDRIVAAPTIFDRQSLARVNYAYNAGERDYFADRHVFWQPARWGDRLIVRGKNVRIGWGAVAITPPEEAGGPYGFETTYEETLIDDIAVATKVIPLGTLAGLAPDTPYYLRGSDIRYAGEVL